MIWEKRSLESETIGETYKAKWRRKLKPRNRKLRKKSFSWDRWDEKKNIRSRDDYLLKEVSKVLSRAEENKHEGYFIVYFIYVYYLMQVAGKKRTTPESAELPRRCPRLRKVKGCLEGYVRGWILFEMEYLTANSGTTPINCHRGLSKAEDISPE